MTVLNDLKQKAQGSALMRMIFLGVLVLFLQIPIAMIDRTIYERDLTRQGALHEVTSTWGAQQTIAGPIIVVPYVTRWLDEKDGKKVEQRSQHYAYFQPDTLVVDGNVTTEVRRRGIFAVPLYLGTLKVSGDFARPDFTAFGVAEHDVQWSAASLIVGVSDPGALREQVTLRWNKRSVTFEPGSSAPALLPAGIHVPGIFAGDAGTADTYKFAFDLVLGGSDRLTFTPVGRDNQVRLASPWPDPSFLGNYLPATREVSAQGFSATWRIPHLGRNYPQSWRDDAVRADALAAATFGVNFMSPVNAYTATTRAVKYEILFVALTFLVFYLIELFKRVRIHPVQYLLVGGAICLFYLLLLALSEHIGFDAAYGVAAIPVVAMVGGYCAVILGQRRLGLYVAGELVALYGFLYTLLQVEDYALLVGSIGLMLVLGALMYVTRRIDWYRVGAEPAAGSTSV